MLKSIAKLIFRTLLPSDSSRDREYLVVEDFEKWTATPKETFESLDLDNSGKITEEEMEEAVVNIYIARDNLCRGLKSNGRIVKKLDYLFWPFAFYWRTDRFSSFRRRSSSFDRIFRHLQHWLRFLIQ